jgi:hypothetical protein
MRVMVASLADPFDVVRRDTHGDPIGAGAVLPGRLAKAGHCGKLTVLPVNRADTGWGSAVRHLRIVFRRAQVAASGADPGGRRFGAHRLLGEPEDCAALTRLVRKARRDAFEVGRANAQAEADGGTE